MRMKMAGREKRRSVRRRVAIPILVKYTDTGNIVREEETETGVVGAYGALVLLSRPVAAGQSVQVMNLRNGLVTVARIVTHVGFAEDGRVRVGLELRYPNYRFWHVWLVNLTFGLVWMVLVLGLALMGLFLVQAAVSTFDEGSYFLGIVGLVVAIGFFIGFVFSIWEVIRRSP